MTALNALPALLDQLRRENFYGSLEIKLEAGEVVLLKKTETIKPAKHPSSTLSRQSRGCLESIER